MAYEPKPGHLSVFKNDKKKEGDNQPNWRGKGLDPNGKPIEVSLWVKDAGKGKFFSGMIKFDTYSADKAKKSASDVYDEESGAGKSNRSPDNFDDDIPF